MMYVHEVDCPTESSWGVPTCLADYDIRDFEHAGAVAVWYWYIGGSYEGSGYALYTNGTRYDVVNLDHCSCNGATDDVSGTYAYASLDDIRGSVEYMRVIQPLVEEARKWEVSHAAVDG